MESADKNALDQPSNMRGQRIAMIAMLFILGAFVGLMVGSRIWR